MGHGGLTGRLDGSARRWLLSAALASPDFASANP
jgi:hypothetical protein